MPSDLAARVRRARQDLDLTDVDYEGTMAAKMGIARELFTRQGHAQLQACTPMLAFREPLTCSHVLL